VFVKLNKPVGSILLLACLSNAYAAAVTLNPVSKAPESYTKPNTTDVPSSISSSTNSSSVNLTSPYRIGFNMIRTTEGKTDRFDTVSEVLNDIEDVGGQGIRQLRGNDLTWFQVYDGTGSLNSSSNYNFNDADEMIKNSNGIYSIPTLFWIGVDSTARYFGDDCPELGASDSQYCKQPYTPAGDLLKMSDKTVRVVEAKRRK